MRIFCTVNDFHIFQQQTAVDFMIKSACSLQVDVLAMLLG